MTLRINTLDREINSLFRKRLTAIIRNSVRLDDDIVFVTLCLVGSKLGKVIFAVVCCLDSDLGTRTCHMRNGQQTVYACRSILSCGRHAAGLAEVNSPRNRISTDRQSTVIQPRLRRRAACRSDKHARGIVKEVLMIVVKSKADAVISFVTIDAVLDDGHVLTVNNVAVTDTACDRSRADTELYIRISRAACYLQEVIRRGWVCRPRAPCSVSTLDAIIKVVAAVYLRTVWLLNSDRGTTIFFDIAAIEVYLCGRKGLAVAALREGHLRR